MQTGHTRPPWGALLGICIWAAPGGETDLVFLQRAEELLSVKLGECYDGATASQRHLHDRHHAIYVKKWQYA